jgi:hypothetical protein
VCFLIELVYFACFAGVHYVVNCLIDYVVGCGTGSNRVRICFF